MKKRNFLCYIDNFLVEKESKIYMNILLVEKEKMYIS